MGRGTGHRGSALRYLNGRISGCRTIEAGNAAIWRSESCELGARTALDSVRFARFFVRLRYIATGHDRAHQLATRLSQRPLARCSSRSGRSERRATRSLGCRGLGDVCYSTVSTVATDCTRQRTMARFVGPSRIAVVDFRAVSGGPLAELDYTATGIR